MGKNVVFITAINHNGNTPYVEPCLKSWREWCETHDVELVVADDYIVSPEHMIPHWQMYYAFEIVDELGIDFDQIAVVDSDTIIHWNCPNFFELTNNQFAAVPDNEDLQWIETSMAHFSPHFPGTVFSWSEYLNAGFMVVNEEHRELFDEMRAFYFRHKDDPKGAKVEKDNLGFDQTPLNFLVRKLGHRITLLPNRYNVQKLHHHNCLYVSTYKNLSGIWHFNSLNKNDRAHYMTRFEKLHDQRHKNERLNSMSIITDPVDEDANNEVGYKYRYSTLYDITFAAIQNENLKILDLGFRNKNMGKVWEQFFPNAEIFAIDLIDCGVNQTEQCKVFMGNPTNPDHIGELADIAGGQFDVIIDDSHFTDVFRQKCLGSLFHYLKPEGLYLLENLPRVLVPASGENSGKTFPPYLKDVVQTFFKDGNLETHHIDFDDLQYLEKNIKYCSVNWKQIAVIQKREEEKTDEVKESESRELDVELQATS